MTILLIVILALLLIAAALLFAVYYKVFYSPYPKQNVLTPPASLSKNGYRDEVIRQTNALAKIPCEEISTRSYDGLYLHGRYYHRSDDAPLCICFHGYHGSPFRDFSVIAQFLRNEGYNMILIDERAHGKSGGHTITYGIRERRDVLTWVDYAIERFGDQKPIYLFGISMGAGTVLMASEYDLPANVKFICADCPLNSPKDVICHVAEKIGWNPKLAWAVIRPAALLYGHLIIHEDITCVNAVKKTKVPILLMHGEADTFVLTEYSRQIHASNPDAIELHTFPDAGHGLSCYVDPDGYFGYVRDFIKRNG